MSKKCASPDIPKECKITHLNLTVMIVCAVGFHQGDKDFFCYLELFDAKQNQFTEQARKKQSCTFLFTDINMNTPHIFRLYTENKYGNNRENGLIIRMGKFDRNIKLSKSIIIGSSVIAIIVVISIICCVISHRIRTPSDAECKSNRGNRKPLTLSHNTQDNNYRYRNNALFDRNNLHNDKYNKNSNYKLSGEYRQKASVAATVENECSIIIDTGLANLHDNHSHNISSIIPTAYVIDKSKGIHCRRICQNISDQQRLMTPMSQALSSNVKDTSLICRSSKDQVKCGKRDKLIIQENIPSMDTQSTRKVVSKSLSTVQSLTASTQQSSAALHANRYYQSRKRYFNASERKLKFETSNSTRYSEESDNSDHNREAIYSAMNSDDYRHSKYFPVTNYGDTSQNDSRGIFHNLDVQQCGFDKKCDDHVTLDSTDKTNGTELIACDGFCSSQLVNDLKFVDMNINDDYLYSPLSNSSTSCQAINDRSYHKDNIADRSGDTYSSSDESSMSADRCADGGIFV
ncbi:hypothetical protein GJ496_007922 [Pomphorhynchus laevis]|nr:hypothetical protein GJ496_007922 [Pomphorhynchus laevis]